MAKTFKFGENGKWATKTGSSLAYNDQNGNFKPAPFSVTRGSIATRVNKQGLIEVVGHDKLRIDYKDSSKGVALLEPARTNLNTLSDPTDAQKGSTSYASVTYQDNFNWGLGSVLENAIVFGDNSTTRYAYYSSTVSSGTVYSLSFFIKMDDNSVPIPATDFLLVLAGTSIASGYTIDNYGNNIYRVSVSGTAGASNTANGILKVASHSAKTFKITGFQIEASSYATSYIPTSGATSQRQADVANGAGNSEVFNDSEGVLYANIAALANDGGSGRLSINDNVSDNDRVLIGFTSTDNQIQGQSRTGVTTQAALSGTVSDATNFSKVAMKYKANDFALWINGFEVDTDLNGTAPVGITKMSFDRTAGLFPFYGKTKEIGYYDAVLTDAELEALTSYTSFTNMANELNLTIK